VKSSFYARTELRSVRNTPRSVFRVFQLNEINPEIAELLELLNAREQFDEIAALFEQSSRPWHQYSEEERNQLVAKAASMMAKGPS
jgi:hypothetical protein